MNGIIGMTGVTLETELTRAQRENLMIVSTLANSLLLIIDDILDISKSERLAVLEAFARIQQADWFYDSRGW